MKPTKPDQHILDYFLSNFDYESETGILYRYSRKYDDWLQCASIHDTGRFRVTVKYKSYYVSNICWFLYYGTWPENEIDHKDNDGYNNKIDNLREASYSKNSTNADRKILNRFHGVHYHDVGKKFRYRFRIEGKQYEVYGFDTAEDAAEAREKHLNALGDTFCVRNKNIR